MDIKQKRKNDSPEQQLVDEYIIFLELKNKITVINSNCRCRSHADLEYILDDVLWVIEAKSHKSKDAYNSVHKIFGELLKETKRIRKSNDQYQFSEIKFGLLIPGDTYTYTNKSGIDFYKSHFNEIDKNKYIEFGKLIPIDDVFIYFIDKKNLIHMRWIEFLEN